MIQPTTHSTIDSSTFSSSTSFTVQADASLFSILTQKVYNNVIAAPIRELSTNACDSCIMSSLPINFDVHLPTDAEPTFSVRDYGSGLPPEDLIGLFTVVGASTKRNSNLVNGTLGIGRLSPLAYSASFMVESFFDDQHHSYLIAVQNGIPCSTHLGTSPSSEPSGLRISFPVVPNDIKKFHNEAELIYRYFDHKPNLNIPLDIAFPSSPIIFDTWFIDTSTSYQYVLMGNVRYRLDFSLVDTHGISGLHLRVPIGSVTINPGRESLSYDPTTVDYLNSCINQVLSDYIDYIDDALSVSTSISEQALSLHTLHKSAPYSIRSNIDISSYPLSQYVHIGKYSTEFKLPHNNTINCGVLFSYRSAPRFGFTTISDYAPILQNNRVLIIDVATNFSSAYQTLSATYLVLARHKGIALDVFLPEAIKWCDDIGVSYTLASTITLPVAAKERTVRELGIYIAPIANSGSICKSRLYDATQHYLYVPLSGTALDIDDKYFAALMSLTQLFRQHSIPLPTIVGVAKKYLPLVESCDNFTLATTYFHGILPLIPFHSYNHEDISFPSVRDSQPHHPVVAQYRQAYSDWTIFCRSNIVISISTLSCITPYFPEITAIPYTPSITKEQLKSRFPLIFELRDSFLAHYLQLEDFYAEHSVHETDGSDVCPSAA